MKRILPLLLILTALAACTGAMRHGKALKEAEALLSSRPETALRMLDSIEQVGDGMGKAERMRWQLLRLTAQNKCYVPFTSDSAAREVADYYDRHGSPNERMAAHYQLGCAYRDMGEPQLQLQAFHKAIESADTTDADCDLWTLSRVYSQMAELFYIHLMPIQEKEALNKAYRYTLQAGDTLAATYELQQMSWVYDRLDQPDSVVYYSKKGYELFSQFGKKAEAAQSLGMAIHAELLKGDFEEAARQLAIYEGESGRFDSLHEVAAGHELYYHDKGFYYLGTGRADSAEASFRKEINRATDLSGLHAGFTGLREVYKRRGLADSTAKYAILSEEYNDSLHARSNTDHLQLMQSMFDYSQHQLKSQQMEHEVYRIRMQNRTLLMGILLAACAIGLIIMAARRRMERHRQKLKATKAELDLQRELSSHYKADIKTTEQTVKSLNDEIAKKTVLIQQLEKERDEGLNMQLDLMRLLRKGKEKELARIKEAILADDTFKKINELLDNDTRPMKKWTQKDFLPDGIYEEMEQVFQRVFPAFGEILHTSGKISQLEFVNCMLVWLGYKAYDICKICCQLPSANSMMRKRLYTKIAGKSGNGKNLEELLQIITPY